MSLRLVPARIGITGDPPLTHWSEGWADIIDVAVGTLDAPHEIVPTDHIWMSDALPWDKPVDGLQHYPGNRLPA